MTFASAGTVSSPSSFEQWLASTAVMPDARTDAVVVRLGDFRELHSAVVSILEAAAAGRPLPGAAVDRINEASALVPFAPRLIVEGGARIGEDPLVRDRAVDVLAAIARSAIRLLGSAEARRLRRCPACRRFFLASRQDRVWCSAACGNRVRVARHHARHRAG